MNFRADVTLKTREALQISRRDQSIDASLGVRTQPVVDNTKLGIRLRGGCDTAAAVLVLNKLCGFCAELRVLLYKL